MATIYGYERFNNPTTKLVHLSGPVTGAMAGATNNEGYTATSGLGQKDVGCIIAVDADKEGVVLTNKLGVTWAAGTSYYLLAEIPVPADDTDHCFVGVMLTDQGMIDNLVPRRPLQNWAKQFYDLKTGGVK